MRAASAHYSTTAYGLTMDWYVAVSHREQPVLQGFIGTRWRFSCQLRPDWTTDQAEQLVKDRLKVIAGGEA